jgi:hypothetical protein
MSTFESIPPGSSHPGAPWPSWPPARSPRNRVPSRPAAEPGTLPPLPTPLPATTLPAGALPATPLPATPLPGTPLPATPLQPSPLQPSPLQPSPVAPTAGPVPPIELRGNPVTVTVQFTVYGEDAFATAAAVADRLRPIVRATEPIRLDRIEPEQHGVMLEAVPDTVIDIPAAPAPATPLRILSAGYRAELDGTALALTRREYDLLLFLAEHPGQVFTRVQLLQTVWQQAFVSGQRTIDVHVRRLRAKLGERGPLIATVRGVGYRLDFADRVAVIREPG